VTTSYRLADGLTVGVEHLWPLLLLPVAVLGLAYLVFRDGGDRSASRRSRRLLFASRLLVVVFLVVGAMAPYTVQTRETPGEPRVTVLTDESNSMGVSPNVTDELVEGVEATGVPVTTATIGGGTDSRLGDGTVANLRENGTVVVLTDGRVTEGRSLDAAAETARGLNATVNRVEVSPVRTERAVSIDGPATASVGLATEFVVSVSGVNIDSPVPAEVSIDGEVVREAELGGDDAVTVTHTFEERGPHRVTARIDSEDVYERNDVFYHSIRVVEKPDVLYVSNGDYPLEGYLTTLYDVTNASSVPTDLEEYSAVVVQDLPAARLGNVSALQEHVIDGGGLAVVGGENAYESGGYAGSPVASMLPVRVGNATGGTTNIVLAIDVSGSTEEGLSTQKAIALDVLDQLGDRNRVGVVAFDNQPYRVADLRVLSESRDDVADRIRRLEAGGGTDLGNGLLGADELLGDGDGTILLLSDGYDRNPTRPVTVANQLGRDGRRIVTVGAAERVDEEVLTRIAGETGGAYFAASERTRLRLLFGGSSRQFRGDNLTIVTPGTFITSGVELSADPPKANDVSIKSGADFQVATADGAPAITSWRFGLGRVVSITSYAEDGSLGGLLERPDSLVVTKSVNFAIGDPARGRSGVRSVGDARVGRQTTLTYRGEERPDAENVTFRQVGEGVYRGEFTPRRAGYGEILDATYAANYPLEYARFGPSPALSALVEATGGETFTTGEAEEISRLARQRATQVRTVRESWDWLFLLAGLLLFALEVTVRRVQVYRGRTSMESGLR